jgi:hypothetical protein
VYPALDLVECFREVADGEGIAETSVAFIAVPVAFTFGVSVGGSLVGGQLVRGDVLEVLVRDRA